MRAVRIHEDLSLRVDETDDLTPKPGEVVVRIHAAGVCGTDLHILDGMIKPDAYPMTLGHEAAGLVDAVGEGVSLEVGTPVAIYNKIFCGRCEQCLKGRTNICDNEPEQLGFNRDGGDAEYVVVPEQNAAPVPDGVDLATASVLTCAGMTAMHATKLSSLQLGDTAVVDGIGGVGIIVVQAAAHAGARVIAVGDSEDKLDLARAHGASDGVLVDTPESYETVAERVRKLTDGRGADVFFELVGTTQTMNAGIRSLAKGGRFVSTGYTDQQLEIHPIEFILSETSFVSTVAATRLDLQDALTLASVGALMVPIAGRYPIEGIGDALDALRKRAVLGRQ
ncbi:MAG: alcohol dehydrogenase catalytic domain-containing protein, partial [Actinomycetota bacterium]|nr:alcohol dehydrogenase catalytic domain-containing protein [Actinomycetota bacterium]